MKTFTATHLVTQSKIISSLSAIALGLTFILGLGFIQDSGNYLHNAVHDGRHSAAFPCH